MQRKLDRKLEQLKKRLLKMSSLVEEAIYVSTKALEEKQKELAEKVIQSDDKINILEIEIDELCLKLLALFQPQASDLRFITSMMKINNDLERMGDLAVNIAEQTIKTIQLPLVKPLEDIPKMAKAVQQMLKDSLNAFVNGDVQLAKDVCTRDDEIDNLNHKIFRELLDYMIKDVKTIERAVGLILIARHLERIADLTTNICEDVIYMVNGLTIKHHVDQR
ncbi:MAG: phosphate signaling complex protein PhoU [bacterium]